MGAFIPRDVRHLIGGLALLAGECSLLTERSGFM
jgi:hypothetical protein